MINRRDFLQTRKPFDPARRNWRGWYEYGGGRGQDAPPPIEPKRFTDPKGFSEVVESQFGSATHRHVRNFLDAVKSRQKPKCDIEVGFNSALPCLLAIVSVKTGRTVKWGGKAARTA